LSCSSSGDIPVCGTFFGVIRKDVDWSDGIGGYLVISFDELFFLHAV
jgi:hypothetical protein